MATTLLDQWRAAYGADVGLPPGDQSYLTFQHRVAVAVAKAAIDISTEAASTTDHANRIAFGKLVLQNAGMYTGAFAIALASEGLDNNSTDIDIRNMVAAIWNGFSG